MMYFSYQALDSAGKRHKGQLEAESPRAARAQLREQGLQPLELQESSRQQHTPNRSSAGHRSTAGRPSFGRGGNLAQISRQLATLVAAGIPLEEALRNLAGQKQSAALASTLDDLARRLREGESFSQALNAHPGLFGPLFTAMVAVGERSGQLDNVLIRMADYQERSRQISRKVQLALIYPAILVLVSIAVISGLMIFVVPRLVSQFEQRDQILPLITQIVIHISEALQQGWFVLPLLPFVGWLLWRFSGRDPQRCLRRDQTLLRLPVLGNFWRLNDIARLARTLSITVGSGLPLLEGMQVAGETVSNQQLKQTLSQVTRQVSEGQPLGRSLLESGEFPDMLVQMVASGERSGELAPLLEKAADHQEQALEQGVSAMLALLEPVLILLLGGMVFAIVLSVLLPVMQLNSMTL